MKSLTAFQRTSTLALAALCVAAIAPAWADQTSHSTPPTTGTTGAATAVPNIPTPDTHPCTVQLFSTIDFTNFSPSSFNYNPPARCRGPWAKVVLKANYSVTAGRQFDRTASIWIGNVNVFFGTTQEPSADIAPRWHVERDLTNYSAWLRKPHPGRTILNNIVNDTYTGVITGSAKLVFYPGSAPDVPDKVVSLSKNPDGAPNRVNSSSPRAGRTVTLPRNMVGLYMDVFAESQGSDEFWELCVPDNVADQLQACGNTGFRQTVIYIDGQPAGVAPVYPWIYTGGVNPDLWRPIPGVQTLNFKPFRVNLTPFAGKLDDGRSHTIKLGVTNAGDYFATVANLLIYRDHRQKVVHGALEQNTLAADPEEKDHVASTGQDTTRVTTTSNRDFIIAGYVDTSRGRVRTRVHQKVDFRSVQNFIIRDKQYRQQLHQMTRTQVKTSTRGLFGLIRQHTSRDYRFPFGFVYQTRTGKNGAETLNVSAKQVYNRRRRSYLGRHHLVFGDNYSNRVRPAVQVKPGSKGNLIEIDPWQSAERVHYQNTQFQCFDRRIASNRHEITRVTNGRGCYFGRNFYFWSPLMNLNSLSSFRGTPAALWHW